MANTGNLGREKLPMWPTDLWDRLDAAVYGEMQRIRVARRLDIPVVPMPDVLTVPADTVSETIVQDTGNGVVLGVSPTATTGVIDVWVEFALTAQQVEGEATMATAITLATRAANRLAQGEDLLINQGDPAIKYNHLFTEGIVHTRAGPGPAGLATRSSLRFEDEQVVDVEFSNSHGSIYGEKTFKAIEVAYAKLQRRGHYGPYSLELPTVQFADAFAPLEDTLVITADRILPLVEGRFYGTGSLPEIPEVFGVMISTGGNSIDLVVAQDAATAFSQVANDGLYRFQVIERFALRDKDPSSRVLLKFPVAE